MGVTTEKLCSCIEKGLCWKKIDNAGSYRFIEPVILLIIYKNKGIHGWELQSKVPGLLPGCELIDKATIYRTLRKLELEELLSSYWNHEDGGVGKRSYEITEQGITRLNDWNGIIEAFINKLMFLKSSLP